MKRETAIKVAVAAVALVGAAAWLSRSRDLSPERERGAPMLPGLEAKADEIAAVEVLRGNATVRLDRQPDGSWALASNDSYPARKELVRAMLVSIAGLTVDDRMTAKKERHAELGLAWPDAEGKARMVRFLGAAPDAPPVAEIVLGDERFAPDAVFARLPGQDQTWRTLGRVQVPYDAMGWLDRTLLALPNGETQRMGFDGLTLAAPAGDADPASGPRPAWIATVPDEQAAGWSGPQRDSATTGLPSFLERLEFDGVRRARADRAPDPKWSIDAETRTATVALRGREEADGVWFTLTALPRPGFTPPEPPKYEGDPHVPDWAKLDAACAGWEFKLPQWKADTLRRMRAADAAPADGGLPMGDALPMGEMGEPAVAAP